MSKHTSNKFGRWNRCPLALIYHIIKGKIAVPPYINQRSAKVIIEMSGQALATSTFGFIRFIDTIKCMFKVDSCRRVA